MPSTASSLRNTLFESKPLTRPTAFDYGFHPWMYTSRGHAVPSERQVSALARAYVRLLKSMTPDELHRALQRQQLRVLVLQIDDSLVWVQYLNE